MTSQEPIPFNSLRKVRLSKEMTLQEVAHIAKTSATQISRLEKGTRYLTPKWLKRMAKALDVEESAILKSDFESRVIQLRPQSEDIMKDGIDYHLDQKLLVHCFNIAVLVAERNPQMSAFTPKLMLLCSMACNGVFLALYRKIGMTAELRETVAQFTVSLYATYVMRQTGKEPNGNETSIDDTFSFFTATTKNPPEEP